MMAIAAAWWVAPVPAYAEVPLPIDAVLTANGQTSLVVDLSASGKPGTRTVTVTRDGQPQPAELVPVMSDDLAVTLVVDTSVAGRAAMPAWLSGAARFILEAPDTTRGLIIADTKPAAPITGVQRGPTEIVRALSTVRPGGERDTAAALNLAARQFPDVPAGHRVTVLYTTATDAGGVSAAELGARFRAAGTILVVVATADGGNYWPDAAAATGGFFAPAGNPVVVPALDQVQTTLSSRYLVVFPTPAQLPATMSVQVGTGDVTLTGTAVVPAPGAAAKPGGLSSGTILKWTLGGAILVALVALAVFVVRRRRPGAAAEPGDRDRDALAQGVADRNAPARSVAARAAADRGGPGPGAAAESGTAGESGPGAPRTPMSRPNAPARVKWATGHNEGPAAGWYSYPLPSGWDTIRDEAPPTGAPTDEAPAGGEPAPTDEAPESGTPEPTEEAAASGTPAPANEAPASGTPVEQAPASPSTAGRSGDSAASRASADEAPESGTRADEAPESGTPADEAPESGTPSPSNESRAGSVPVNEAPANGTPAEEAPAREMRAPATGAPADSMATPVNETLANGTTAPTPEAPAGGMLTPTQGGPANGAPADETLTNGTPAPADEAPANDMSTPTHEDVPANDDAPATAAGRATPGTNGVAVGRIRADWAGRFSTSAPIAADQAGPEAYQHDKAGPAADRNDAVAADAGRVETGWADAGRADATAAGGDEVDADDAAEAYPVRAAAEADSPAAKSAPRDADEPAAPGLGDTAVQSWTGTAPWAGYRSVYSLPEGPVPRGPLPPIVRGRAHVPPAVAQGRAQVSPAIARGQAHVPSPRQPEPDPADKRADTSNDTSAGTSNDSSAGTNADKSTVTSTDTGTDTDAEMRTDKTTPDPSAEVKTERAD